MRGVGGVPMSRVGAVPMRGVGDGGVCEMRGV